MHPENSFSSDLFVCMEFLDSYGDVTIASEGLQILTYARHSCRVANVL